MKRSIAGAMQTALLDESHSADAVTTAVHTPHAWRTLATFFLLMCNQCLFWFTFSSGGKPGVKEYFGWTDNGTLDLLLACGPIAGLLVQPLATSLLSRRHGLAYSMRLAAALSLGCALLRCVPCLLGDVDRREGSVTLPLVVLAQVRDVTKMPACLPA